MKQYLQEPGFDELARSGEQPRNPSPSKIAKYRRQFIARALFKQEQMALKTRQQI